MREVEAKLVRTDGGACLANVVAEHVLQRLVQQVRRRVVRHRRKAHAPGNDGPHAVALGEAVPLDQQHLIVLEPICIAQVGTRRRIAVELDPPRVGDLTAARRIERRLAELSEVQPFLQLLERAELRQHIGFLVADELRTEAR